MRTSALPRLAAAALAAAAVLTAAAAPASAAAAEDQFIHHYDVLVEAEAQFAHRAEHPPTALGVTYNESAANLTWTTAVKDFAFYDVTPGSGFGADHAFAVKDARYSYHLANQKPDTGTCTGEGASAQPAQLSGTGVPTPDGGRQVKIDLLGQLEVDLPACTGSGKPTRLVLPKPRGAATAPFETTFDMPKAAIGQGKIIQLLERRVEGAECPDRESSLTVSCLLTWKAVVTFTKTRTERLPALKEDDLLVPLTPKPAPAPPAPAPPAPTPAPPAATGDDDLLVPLAKAKVTPSAASVPVVCPAGCRGTVVARAGRTVVARRTFTAAPGRPATVRLRFAGAARRAVRRAGGVRVTVAATPRGARTPVRRTVALRLRQR